MAANDILEITNRITGIKLALFLYRLIQLVLLPFLVLYFLARLIRERSYRARFRERLGFLPQSFTRTKAGSIWFHAVSVGEVASALPLLRILRAEQPSVPLYLSTATVAGRRAAASQASALVDGIFYSPIDFVFCIRRVLRRIRPALLVVLETEIWPNLYNETKRSGARLAIVNGRISTRTWPRYRLLTRWLSPILKLPDLIFAQSAEDCDRYARLGASIQKLSTAPNLKYEASLAAPLVEINTFGARQIWVAASTVGPNDRGNLKKHNVDEDQVVLRAFQELAAESPELLLILAPRQPDRFEAVAQELEARNISFVKRSAAKLDRSLSLRLPGVLLLDTLGELAGVYRYAQVAFVGGSLAPRGGHNILEPAAAGVPIIVGPHMENFAAIAQDFLQAGALVQINGDDDLLPAVKELFQNSGKAERLRSNALRLIEARRGAVEQTAERLWLLYYCAAYRETRSFLVRSIFTFLAVLWKEGGVLKRYSSEHAALTLAPLPVPVVSIGGITIGGSGKTPFTTYLARQLKARGYQTAILTRGYRRRSPAQSLVLAPGTQIPSAATGDEAQIFLRMGDAPIGIGSDRYQTAKILLRQFPLTDVLLLDDGFQHSRLQRDFDLVVIDGLDAFGGEEVVPLGRLREPLTALARASAFVVTRAEEPLRFRAVKERLTELHPGAPVFRTRLIPGAWRDCRNGNLISSLKGRRLGAFCGLGNPQSFWRTLESLGLNVVFRWTFPDHHAYKPFELQRVAHQARMHGAEILVTTEKDRNNCPTQLFQAIAPFDLAWLEIELELEDQNRFLDLLEQLLVRAPSRHFAR